MTYDLTSPDEDKEMFISVSGGMLIQDLDNKSSADYEINVVTKKQPTTSELKDLLFAMKVCKHVKSNAITLVKENKTIGVGAGQMNRVGAAHIAMEQAKKTRLHRQYCSCQRCVFSV